MHRAAQPRTNGHASPSPATKLAFVDALIASNSLVEAAQLGVEWLARHLRVRQVAIALGDLERPAGARLVLAASHGLPPREVADFAVDLDDREHPLVQAL
ncbi:MAG: hypothetical protein KF850_40030 [Labilithrix sp.]|nr:hypothetical protein [Labilithrix sp.]